jgi:peptide/nickel transport system substrate-binding protein
MKILKILVLSVLILMIATGIVFANGGSQAGGASGSLDKDNLPRKETLYYFNQWGPITGYNPYGNSNNLFISREVEVVFETLFLYNILDGKLYPQIGESYTWNGQNMTVILNRNVKFSDGQALTAADVVNSYELQKTYTTEYSGYWFYLDSVTAQDN